MSRDEVTAVREFGPYKPVPSTGGVETFDAKWDGKKTNVSFLFADERLMKVQIWAYEGKDEDKALSEWIHVAKYLRATFGAIEFPGSPELSPEAKEEEIKAFYRRRLHAIPNDSTVKFQMGLKTMPAGAIIFASLFRQPETGDYYVFLFYRKA